MLTILSIKKIFEIKAIVLFLIVITAIGCQGNAEKPRPQLKANSTPLVRTNPSTIENKNIIQKKGSIDNLEKKILLIQAQLDINSRLIDSNYVSNKETLDKFSNANFEQEYLNILNNMQQKIQILEDRTFYTDSLYFEIMTDIVMIENKISSLLLSFQEMNDLENKKSIDLLPKITDEEYTQKYIEALANYQNAEWDSSLNGFDFLIRVNRNHDLADNCQYWIGEIYYALNDYKKSIREFEKVFSFSGTNKGDDAQFKIGLCFMNIGQNDNAIIEFSKLLDSYPNSEYYSRAKNYINQY